MTDESCSEGYTKEYVESLKAKLEEKNEESAKLRAFKSVHDEKQRALLAKLQPDINEFIGNLTSSNPEQANDMQPIVEWGKSCHESNSLETAMPLARVISCASAQYKRTREEASMMSTKAESHAATLKELEEVKAERDAKAVRLSELESHISLQNSANEKMQEELAKAGLLKEKFDFSKIGSREAKTESVPSVASVPAVMTTIKSEASRGSSAVEDQLLSFISRTSTSGVGNRVSQSATGHAFLGATSGGINEEIANAIRGSS